MTKTEIIEAIKELASVLRSDSIPGQSFFSKDEQEIIKSKLIELIKQL